MIDLNLLEALSASAPETKMPDGTVFAGISPDTNKPMYATPLDAPLTMTFNEAQKYAAKLDAHGHQDWCLPTTAELNMMLFNKGAVRGFDLTGSYPAGWYWSASPYYALRARDQRASPHSYKLDQSSVRCVRYGPLPTVAKDNEGTRKAAQQHQDRSGFTLKFKI